VLTFSSAIIDNNYSPGHGSASIGVGVALIPLHVPYYPYE
jgi:hypothetical protein